MKGFYYLPPKVWLVQREFLRKAGHISSNQFRNHETNAEIWQLAFLESNLLSTKHVGSSAGVRFASRFVGLSKGFELCQKIQPVKAFKLLSRTISDSRNTPKNAVLTFRNLGNHKGFHKGAIKGPCKALKRRFKEPYKAL